MRVPIFAVDAFTDRLFAGDPAAVCLLGRWPSDERLRSIATENNLSMTAFVVREDGCTLAGDRVELVGRTVLFMHGVAEV